VRDSLPVRFQELSQGIKARLAFVRSLIHDPPILLFDEPFQSVDVGMMNQLKDWIFHDLVQGHRKTVVFVSHRSEEFEGWDCRLVSLSNGCITHDRQIESCRESLWKSEAVISGEKP
jgi:ABC-2 type transport system ATP-binding protein